MPLEAPQEKWQKVAQRTKATKIGGFENRFFGRKYRFLEVCVGKPTGFVHDWVRHFFNQLFWSNPEPTATMMISSIDFFTSKASFVSKIE